MSSCETWSASTISTPISTLTLAGQACLSNAIQTANCRRMVKGLCSAEFGLRAEYIHARWTRWGHRRAWRYGGEHVLPIQTGGNFIVEHPANEQQRNCPSGIFTRLRELAVRGQDRKHNRIRSEGGRFCWAVQMVDPRGASIMQAFYIFTIY